MYRFYVPTVDGIPRSEWHLLEERLKGTAELAASFASEFGCGEWGYLAGLWHDGGGVTPCLHLLLVRLLTFL